MSSDLPHSKEVERYCLASCITYPELIPNILPFVGPEDFYVDGHDTIFTVIKQFIVEGLLPDRTLIIDRLNSLSLNFVAGVPTADYLKSISRQDQIIKGSFVNYFKELKKYSVCRSYVKIGRDISKQASSNLDKPVAEIISGIERTFGDTINAFESENEPSDLFEGIEDFIEEIGNEPRDMGITAPYPSYRKYYGDFLRGGLYVFCAPPKCGKSTFLMDALKKACHGDNVKALYLDTELTAEEQRYRVVSALSGVKEFYLRTGRWRQDSVMLEKVRSVWPEIKKMEGKIDHFYVAGKPIHEIVSIVRRWYYKRVKEGDDGIVAYDYIKLTGEKISEHWKEYQVIGEKSTMLKDLAQELKIPILAAIQTNSYGEVAMSKQVKWFANVLAYLKKKDPDELLADGVDFGSHTLEVTDCRNQGEAGMGFDDLIKDEEGKFRRLNIHLRFDNFVVEEVGTLKELIELKQKEINLDEQDAEDHMF